MFKQGFTCPALLFGVPSRILFEYGVITLYDRPFHAVPLKIQDFMTQWAVPVSLATTQGISVDFFSSGYLDVSVPRVRLLHLCIQYRIPLTRWVSPFGHLRIKACCQLPEAYRRLPRPSSPPAA